MKKYGLLLFSLFFIIKCQVIPLIKIAKTTSAVKTEIIATNEVTKALEGTAELTKETVKVAKAVVKKVKQAQKTIAIATALTKDQELEKPMKDMTAEELFAKMFGSKASSQAVTDLVVPMIINKKFASKTTLNMIQGEAFVSIASLRDSLEEFLKADLLAEIFSPANVTSNGLALKILEQYGITAFFDDNDVIVKIDIAPNMVKNHDFVLSGGRKKADKAFEKIIKAESVPISGASNFFARDTFSSANKGATLIRAAAELRNRTFVNVYDYIFDTGLIVTEQKTGITGANTLNRDYSYVSRDFPQSNHRLKIGDVALTGSNTMVSSNILGVSLLKHHDVTRRMHQSIRLTHKEIFLENESRLQIFVNDKLVRTLDLEPGSHSISDFPLTSGTNNIKIKITDILGNEKIIDYDEFSFTELLKKDVSTYGLSIGVPSNKISDGSIQYNMQKPTLSAYYDFGLTDNMTFKSGLQMNDEVTAYSGEFLFGSTLGLFSIYGVQSNTQQYGLGNKYGVAYIQHFNDTTFSLKQEVVDDNYKDIVGLLSLSKASNTLSAIYSTKLFNSGYLSLNYRDSTTLTTATQSYGFAYSYNLSPEWDFRSTYDQIYSNNIESMQASFYLSYRPRGSRFSYRSTFAYADPYASKKFEADMSPQGRYGLNSVYTYSDNGADIYSNTLRADYMENAYYVQSSYAQTANKEGTLTKQGSLGFATGVAFVGKDVAVTQPISNSFILVKNDKRIKEPLGVMSFNENNPSRSFVVPMGDYSTKQLKISDKNLIFGAELVENEYDVVAKYRTGKMITITPKFTLSAKGIIYNSDNQVLDKKVFKLYKLGKDGALLPFGEDDIFFTNAQGKFILGAVEAGRYKAVEINADTPYEFVFTIETPEEDSGMVNLGDLIVLKAEVPSINLDG